MKNKQRFLAATCLLVLPLAYPGDARADRLKHYLTDGAIETSPGVYANSNDGLCVVGVKFDGTLDVNPAIDNYKDCIVYTTPAIKALGQTACNGGAGNDGFKHAWSTSICVDGSNNPISRVDLDNTPQMCAALGGTIRTAGLCVAHSWQYMNVKPSGEPIPYRGTISPVPAGYKGRTSADGLGFCYTAMRMTSVVGYNVGTVGGCPSYHNSATGNAAEWPLGTDGVAYQTQASYDAGLGWSFSSSQCVHAYGVRGYVNGAITRADGTTIAANTYVDATTPNKGPAFYTTMGDCLANGYSWDNWLPTPPATLVTGIATTLPSDVVKLDSLTPIASGGGQFYSGTGSVCLKCHTDQSRGYVERNKLGWVETNHKLIGDTNPAWDPAPEWGLKGVQCTVCHATGRPAQQDVGLVVYPNTTGPNAGLPRSASGHNQTEYGSHTTGVCYQCHGQKTSPLTGNPAAVIPVSGGDFAPTSKGVTPIANQFLNSPHAKYTGDSNTVNVITRTNYASPFVGYICRSEVGDQSRTYSTSAACTGAGFSWTTSPWSAASVCVHNATSCAAAGLRWDTVQNPYGGGTVGGVCYGVGVGSILTTVYRNGAAEKIHTVDSLTNPMCTNLPDGTPTSGAGGYWVRDGELGGVANGVAYVSSDQGSCMTCHDVHWQFGSTIPEAEPIRRECTTCHVAPGASSASGAPQINLATINHLGGAGTPLANAASDPDSSCEICHMPKSGPAAGSKAMHLWRINTTAAYTTMGATKANVDAGGQAWVDVDHACGQCHSHGGSAPQYTTAQLASVAQGMHAAAAAAYAVTFTAKVTGVTVAVDATVDCGGTCPALTYDWSWGDGTANGTTDPAAHAYATPGAKTITLTVSQAGKTVGTVSRTVTTIAADLAPTAAATCTWNANTWTMTAVDASTDDGPDADALPGDGNAALQVVLDWGDGTAKTITTRGSTSTHVYARPGSFTVTDRANDVKLQTGVANCTGGTATPAYFTITGTVRRSNNNPVPSATVKIKRGATLVKALATSATGTFTTGATLPPGTYTITASKVGFTFAVPAWSGAIGPSATAITINSTIP